MFEIKTFEINEIHNSQVHRELRCDAHGHFCLIFENRCYQAQFLFFYYDVIDPIRSFLSFSNFKLL